MDSENSFANQLERNRQVLVARQAADEKSLDSQRVISLGADMERDMERQQDAEARSLPNPLGRLKSVFKRDTLRSFFASAAVALDQRNENRLTREQPAVQVNRTFANSSIGMSAYNPIVLTPEEIEEVHHDPRSIVKSEDKLLAMKRKEHREKQDKRDKETYEAYVNECKAGRPRIMLKTDSLMNTDYVDDYVTCKYIEIDGEKNPQFVAYRSMVKGNFSHMEKTDIIIRNVAASEYMSALAVPAHTTAEGFIDSIMDKEGVRGLMNPLLRIGLSLCIHDERYTQVFGPFAACFPTAAAVRDLEAKINARVMAETILKVPDTTELQFEYGIRDAHEYAGLPDEEKKKEIKKNTKKIKKLNDDLERNRKSQIFMAKTMLAAQLGNFRLKTGNAEGAWTGPVANAFAHCSRVGIVLPGKQGSAYKDSDRDATTAAFIGKNKGEGSGFYGRITATHAIKTKAKGMGRQFEEKKKSWGWILGQYGMNVAIGGMGNRTINNPDEGFISNDGKHGHIYMHLESGNKDHYTGLLIGFESDAPGKTNLLGHTHGAGNPEFASSFGGQRIDEVGNKYGGRVVDLSTVDEEAFRFVMDGLETTMRGYMESTNEAEILMYRHMIEVLCGPPVQKNGNEFKDILRICLMNNPEIGNRDVEGLVTRLTMTAQGVNAHA